MNTPLPEPWLRGPVAGLDARLAPLVRCLEQVREDLDQWTAGLTPQQLWNARGDLAPAGFHLRHIAQSVDRLFTYALGRQLSEQQVAEMKSEAVPGEDRDALLARIDAVFRRVEEEVRRIDPAQLTDPRLVGRKQLPSTLAGLLVHIAEHTQRHAGQAIVTAKLARKHVPCAFDHVGIPTVEQHAEEMYVPETKVFVTDPARHPQRIEYLRFEPDSPVHGPVRDLPHTAYRVGSLDAAIAGDEVILGPFQPTETLRIAFVMKDGAVLEFMESSVAGHWFRATP